MSVVFRDDQFIPIQGMYDSTWRADRDKVGAGTLLEHSIHDLDLLEFLLGPAPRVTGHAAEFHGHEGIEDVVVASLAFESGAFASLTSVWHDVLERPEPAARRGVLRAGVLRARGRRVRTGALDPSRARATAQAENDTLIRELAARGCAPTPPRCGVHRGRADRNTGVPRLRRSVARPRAHRRDLPVGGRRRRQRHGLTASSGDLHDDLADRATLGQLDERVRERRRGRPHCDTNGLTTPER